MLRTLIVAAIVSIAALAGQAQARVRQYYIAADEVEWNYMPSGQDGMMGMAPMGYAKFYATHDAHLIGPVYKKAIYREYTDATFKTLKPRPASQAYLGILGPILHAEVGDTIKVRFRNNASWPYSLHPHGVFYEKASEGSPYADGVPMADKGGDAVAPGHQFDYVWQVPERAGPGPRDPSSIVWFYHSHVEERADVNAGLIGALIVTRKGMARPDGTPKDVDKEFVTLYQAFDENRSHYIGDNIRRVTGDPKAVDISKNSPFDTEGHFDPLIGTGPGAQNFRFTINGYQFANMPPPVMKRGERVRWYVITLGEGLNFHTPHWHGNTVLVNGQRTDVIAVSPAQMVTADMVPDAAGLWMMHCHVSDHMDSGMSAMYRVLP
ncbi:MAG TPA: multicopper oxidase domain-containing protein [Caulobacteraceae bacterium]|jgi:FtsP/CotA-like multicopper oxidase with cupredoxin domain|nr:multicopper oxidase domain-containing protein [Caulobacteraceae bacterium]